MRDRGHRVESMNSESLAGRGPPLSEPTQAELDAALERMIETAYRASLCTADPELQQAGADAHRRLVAQRSKAD
jgi:hypothetical protein